MNKPIPFDGLTAQITELNPVRAIGRVKKVASGLVHIAGLAGKANAHLSQLTANTREALLLHTIEEFSFEDVSHILDTDEDEARSLVNLAYEEMAQTLSGRVMIIEDEAIIAMDLEGIVGDMGHRVTGIARTRDRAVIFVPSDVAPQEIRDCLHEELAQALGPLNDLYRLPDSVFNDDNIHTVLTGFDMLILRAYYAPELSSGLTRGAVAQRLPGLLARLNPSGQSVFGTAGADTSRDWITAMETALNQSGTPNSRRRAAERAIAIGQTLGWTGPREGFAYYAYGRLQVSNDPGRALEAFNAAEAAYRRSPDTTIHAAHIAVQKSAFALASGDAQATLTLVDRAIPVAERHQNAALMSTLMMFKAEALDMVGNTVDAQAVRLDSLGWARYGFGSDANVQARVSEIAALRPF